MTRQMMVVFVDADHREDVERIFEEYEPVGYSIIPDVLGKGVTGRKFGSRAFPGSNTCYIAAVTDDCGDKITARLRALVKAKGLDEGLKVFSLASQEVI